jgi:hypothetical protein
MAKLTNRSSPARSSPPEDGLDNDATAYESLTETMISKKRSSALKHDDYRQRRSMLTRQAA